MQQTRKGKTDPWSKKFCIIVPGKGEVSFLAERSGIGIE
jgi:hypothetical protein